MLTTRRDLLRLLPFLTTFGTLGMFGPRGAWGEQHGEAASLEPSGSTPTVRTADRLAWFDAAGLGLFLHWGPYSAAGVEASWPIMEPGLAKILPQPAITEQEYRALPQRFNPVDFDPAAWVALARSAGMQYMVLTAKHHDGFCMFDAPGTEYKITRTPYGRDICAELAAACAAAEMPLGFYYSPPDMHHAGYRDISRPTAENWTGEPDRAEWSGYLDFMEAHLRKLLTDYGDVAVIWFDGLFDHQRFQPERFHRLIRDLSPRTLVNDRLGSGDYETPEQFFPTGIPIKRHGGTPQISEAALVGFFDLLLSDRPREEIEDLFVAAQKMRFPTALHPTPSQFQRWETCMTMNQSWAYNPSDLDWKSAGELVRTLVEVASRGGNLLLNVGPNGRGTFPEQAKQRLRAIGKFMSRSKTAIHNTTYGPVQGMPGVRSTERDGVVFLFLLDPVQGSIALADFQRPVSRVRRVGDGTACEFALNRSRASIGKTLHIKLPPSSGDEQADAVVVLAVEA